MVAFLIRDRQNYAQTMTLITAWTTNEFRIVASDALCHDERGRTSVCQKVLANQSIAIGLYGSSTQKNREKLEIVLKQNQDISPTKFKELVIEEFNFELCSTCEEIDFTSKHVTHILVVPKSNKPQILCIQAGIKPYFNSLEKYLKAINSQLTDEMFFSEQMEDNYNDLLFKHFERIKTLIGFDVANSNELSLIELFKEFYSSVYYESDIKKETIGGGKIYLAYSFDNSVWKQIEILPIPYEFYHGRIFNYDRFWE
ncbi:MAG: hypothetical protein R2764_18765 [Bacteroidales bacterium]